MHHKYYLRNIIRAKVEDAKQKQRSRALCVKDKIKFNASLAFLQGLHKTAEELEEVEEAKEEDYEDVESLLNALSFGYALSGLLKERPRST